MTRLERTSDSDIHVPSTPGSFTNEALDLFVPLGMQRQPNEIPSPLWRAHNASSAWLPDVLIDFPPTSPMQPRMFNAIPSIAIYEGAPPDFYPNVPRISANPRHDAIPSIAIYEGAPADFYPNVPRISSQPGRAYLQSLAPYLGPAAQNRVFATDPHQPLIAMSRSHHWV